MPPFTQTALRLLRDPSHFKWNAVFFLALVMYVYAVEIEKRNWSTVLAGLALWSADGINETINALILHFTGYAAIWTATGDTSYQITIGLNYEIALMFSIAGIVFTKQLPKDKHARLLGVPNRWLFVLGFSLFSVFIEVLINRAGYLHWAYRWWNVPHVELIVVFGYMTFYAAAAWVHDMERVSSKLKATGVLAGVAATGFILFGPILGWI